MKKKGELKTLFLFLFLQERECLPPSYSLKFVEGVKLSFCLILSAFQKAVYFCGTSHGVSFS